MNRTPLIIGGSLAVVAVVVAVALAGGGGGPPAAAPAATATSSTTAVTTAPGELLPPQEVPGHLAHLTSVWATDWTRATVDLDEILPGLQAANPRDLIAPLDNPTLESVASADDWLADREPGVLFQEFGVTRFYPLQILTSHEIVNDTAGGVPVAVTYCPLCNSAVAFRREVDGQVIRLGTSGLLRNSDLIMWDDRSESLWQQITGEAIVGERAGNRLEFLPVSLVSWGDLKSNFPDAEVLSQDTGFPFDYGRNGYVGYTSRDRDYGYYSGPVDDRLPALERVVGVRVEGIAKAYPFSVISTERAVDDEVAGVAITVWWGSADTADNLDTPRIVDGQAVGTGVAYERRVADRTLTFSAIGDSEFEDAETGSRWTILGIATSGPLAGTQLTPVLHLNEFWFAWWGFNTGADVYLP